MQQLQQQQQAVAYFPDNQPVSGYVIFEGNDETCIVRAYFSKLPPGDHGFHIHKAGDLRGEGCHGACDHYHVGPPCDHGGPPSSSSSRSNRHTGDLGNISTKAGPFYKSYELKGVSVEDLYGRSVIVHADPDDLGKGPHEDSKTTGHSGKRIACAIIGRAQTNAVVTNAVVTNAVVSKRATLKAPKRK